MINPPNLPEPRTITLYEEGALPEFIFPSDGICSRCVEHPGTTSISIAGVKPKSFGGITVKTTHTTRLPICPECKAELELVETTSLLDLIHLN